MQNSRLIGETAKILKRPEHQVRRAFDDLWPDTNRASHFRVVPEDGICELAAAIERRFGKATEAVSS